MINYSTPSDFTEDSVRKYIFINFDGGTLTNEDLYLESLELTESLFSSENLTFGAVEAAQFKFITGDMNVELLGKTIIPSIRFDGTKVFTLGRYKVVSDKPTADKTKREIIAYDALYEVISKDVSAIYNKLLPVGASMTLKAFREAVISELGLTGTEQDLPNDDMTISRGIDPEEMTGKDLLSVIGEACGAFAHIKRSGSFEWVTLKPIIEGLYPADTLYPDEDLYPREDGNCYGIDPVLYENVTFEDYRVEKITGVNIKQGPDDVGTTVGSAGNIYVLQNNFLMYGKSSSELATIGNNLLDAIKDIWYMPSEIVLKGNPMFEVGDAYKVLTKYQVIYAYIFQRHMKGIQALVDTWVSTGEQRRSSEATLSTQIKQLKGITHTLKNTNDELASEITDLASQTSSSIQQLAGSIAAKVSSSGGTQAFGWVLTDSGWRLYNQSKDVLVANSSGITVNGNISSVSGDGQNVASINAGLISGTIANIGWCDANIVTARTNITVGGTAVSLEGHSHTITPTKGAVTEGSGSHNFMYGFSTSAGTNGFEYTYGYVSGSLSDKRLKENVKPLDDITEKYMKLVPVSFNFHDDINCVFKGKHFGYVAQDVKEIFDEDNLALVCEEATEDENVLHYTDGEKPLIIDKDELHALHTRMIQSQQREIEELKKMVASLSERVSRLESKNE